MASPSERAELFALRFRGNANHLAIQFGGPLYLVGSFVTAEIPDGIDPRLVVGDIDLRLMIEREDAEAMFGKGFDDSALDWSPGRISRGREELKQSRRLTRRWKGAAGPRRFDFQFQVSIWNTNGTEPVMPDKPFLRLDRIPNECFLAGRGDP